jgi:hypothetical protein
MGDAGRSAQQGVRRDGSDAGHDCSRGIADGIRAGQNDVVTAARYRAGGA